MCLDWSNAVRMSDLQLGRSRLVREVRVLHLGGVLYDGQGFIFHLPDGCAAVERVSALGAVRKSRHDHVPALRTEEGAHIIGLMGLDIRKVQGYSDGLHSSSPSRSDP